jgi:hypothetical protein
MAITAPIAGAYVGTYDRNGAGALPLAYTRTGYNLNFTQKAERVEETDIYGLNLIEMIYRGANLTIDTICKVYSSVTRGAFWPWMTTVGQVYNAAFPISQLGSAINNILLLTAVANTPAAVAQSPLTCTANVIISPDNNLQIVFNSTLREVPLKFDVLLRDSGGTGSLFTMTGTGA